VARKAAKNVKVDLPVSPLSDLMRWWQAQQTSGLLIGGLAVAFLGRPRVTRDIDVLVLLAEELWQPFMDAWGSQLDGLPRVAVPES
jgi:hypothetical protein